MKYYPAGPGAPVIVVGGGPAGASCAWRLAASGHSPVTILDRSTFPRDKVCGGVLSERGSSKLLESGMLSRDELDSLTLCTHDTITFWNRDELLRTYTSPRDPVRMVSRREFDDFLLGRAKEAGARVLQGKTVREIGPEEVQTSEGESLPFDRLVGADGCGSAVRSYLESSGGSAGRSKPGIGMEYFLPPGSLADMPPGLNIVFGNIPYGYIWVFPDPEKVNAGAGSLGRRVEPSRVVHELQSFLRRRNVSFGAERIMGASIPSLSLNRRMGRGRIYLAGDAAGTVDAVSGEGMGYAVGSGLLAADDILAGGDRSVIGKRGRECWGPVAESRFYRHLLYNPLTFGTAMRSLRDSETFAAGYWSLISGSTSYRGMIRRVLDL